MILDAKDEEDDHKAYWWLDLAFEDEHLQDQKLDHKVFLSSKKCSIYEGTRFMYYLYF